MKKILFRALIIALILGPLTAFVSSVIWFGHAARYEPPISEDEMRQMDKLPVKQVQALLAERRIELTRTQWLAESIRYSYFWKNLAKRSFLPVTSIFLACTCMGIIERRKVGGPVDSIN